MQIRFLAAVISTHFLTEPEGDVSVTLRRRVGQRAQILRANK